MSTNSFHFATYWLAMLYSHLHVTPFFKLFVLMKIFFVTIKYKKILTQVFFEKSRLIALLKQGSFELAKWRSNFGEVMHEAIDGKAVIAQDSTSVLGIVRNYREDAFQFKVQSPVQPENITKRGYDQDTPLTTGLHEK